MVRSRTLPRSWEDRGEHRVTNNDLCLPLWDGSTNHSIALDQRQTIRSSFPDTETEAHRGRVTQIMWPADNREPKPPVLHLGVPPHSPYPTSASMFPSREPLRGCPWACAPWFHRTVPRAGNPLWSTAPPLCPSDFPQETFSDRLVGLQESKPNLPNDAKRKGHVFLHEWELDGHRGQRPAATDGRGAWVTVSALS